MLCKESGNIRQREDYLPSLLCPYALQRKWKHQAERRLPSFTSLSYALQIKWKHQAERRLPTFTKKGKHQAERKLPNSSSLSLCSAKKVETSGREKTTTFTSLSLCSAKKVETSDREKTTYLHFSVPMLCQESGNIRQREDYLASLLCPYALQRNGSIRQREDYLPLLLCPYALQRKWKHQAERRQPSFTSLSLCSANKVETSGREKTTYLHFSVPMLCKESGNIRQREDYLPSLLCPYALQRKWKHQAERRLPTFTSLSLRSAKKGKHQAERKLPNSSSLSLCSAKKVETSGREKTTTFTSLSLCSAKKVETSDREKTTYLHFSVPMLCQESGNIRQREDYLASLLCPYALQRNGSIRQREDYLPLLLCPYALQRKWKHQAERRQPSFTSLSLCSANKVETSGREKTTYLHFSVPMLCKESGNIRQREDYLPSLLCPYALQRKWKHQAERRLPTFTSLSLRSAKKGKHQAERKLPNSSSLSLCSAKKVETSGREKTTTFTSLSLCSAKKVETSDREKTTYLHFSVPMLCQESGNIRQREDYLASLLCPYALQRNGSIRQREDYLPLLLCPYALQRKWKHQAERRQPSFTSLSLCSANKVETSGREKTTYLHFSVPMLCKESGNIRQREDYLPSLLCPYALQRKWKHQAERRLPTFTSLSLCSAKKVETSGREKTT